MGYLTDFEKRADHGILVDLLVKDNPAATTKEIRADVKAVREFVIDLLETHKNGGVMKPTDPEKLRTWKTVGRHTMPNPEVATMTFHDRADIDFIHSIRETSPVIIGITDLTPSVEDEEDSKEALELSEAA